MIKKFRQYPINKLSFRLTSRIVSIGRIVRGLLSSKTRQWMIYFASTTILE